MTESSPAAPERRAAPRCGPLRRVRAAGPALALAAWAGLAFVVAGAPAAPAAAGEKAPPAEPAKPAPAASSLKEPFPDPYSGVPAFVEAAMSQMAGGHGREREALAKAMDLSFEPAFYTLNDLQGYSKPAPRSAALVAKALEKEGQGEFREALEIYQKVVTDYPEDLHRISKYGIYVPVSQYCQRRILQFPARDLQFYREKHDQRAREAFEQALAKHSLEGLAEVRDRMLATSYGGPACWPWATRPSTAATAWRPWSTTRRSGTSSPTRTCTPPSWA